MDSIPGAAVIASTINALIAAWDGVVLGRSVHAEPGSAADLDRRDYESAPGLEGVALKPAGVAMWTCASVIQVARSVAALFDASDRYALTFGHLPGVRSVLEGAGQVAWVILGKDDFDGQIPVEPEARRQRSARAAVVWAECLWRALEDTRSQGLDDEADGIANQLDEWERDVRVAFPDLTTKGKWVAAGARVPQSTDIADLGLALARWPEPATTSLYPWLSAATHHKLYPFINSLEPTTINGLPVRRVAPDPDEVAAGGTLTAWALMRMCELATAYLGWPTDGYHEAVGGGHAPASLHEPNTTNPPPNQGG